MPDPQATPERVDLWWEARVVAHVQAPTREAADDVISSLFDRDEVMGGPGA